MASITGIDKGDALAKVTRPQLYLVSEVIKMNQVSTFEKISIDELAELGEVPRDEPGEPCDPKTLSAWYKGEGMCSEGMYDNSCYFPPSKEEVEFAMHMEADQSIGPVPQEFFNDYGQPETVCLLMSMLQFV